MFGVGAATVLLLFIGIHNAWDNVTFIVLTIIPPPAQDPEETEGVPGDRVNAGTGDPPPAVSANHADQLSSQSHAWATGQPAPTRETL